MEEKNDTLQEEEQVLTDEEEEYNKAFFGEEEADSEGGSEEESSNEDEPAEEPVQTEEPQKNEDESPEEESKDQPQSEFKPLKWKGQEIPVESIDELYELAQKGFDYTYKTQVLAEHKNKIKKMEELGLNDKDLELLAKIKQGDKEALAYLSKETGIDPVDILDIEEPNVEFSATQAEEDFSISPDVEPILESIKQNGELVSKMAQAEEILPDSVVKVMAQDPNALVAVATEVETGRFFDVMPKVMKEIGTLPEYRQKVVLNNPDMFADIYAKYVSEPQSVEKKKEAPKPKVNPEAIKPQNSSVPDRRKQVLDDYDDIWNMSEDEFKRKVQKIKHRI